MKRWISLLFGFCVIVVSLVASVKGWALNPNFYYNIYEKTDLASQLDVSSEDLNQSITVLLDYLEDERSSISFQIDGEDMFNQRETLHMIDVKALYQNTMHVAYVCLGLMFVIIVYFYIKNKEFMIAYLTRGILRAGLCFAFFMTLLGIWMATDFNDFWVWFHHVFFPQNDYWLLTPGRDFMIDMLPETVFSALVLRIVLTCIVILLVIYGFSFYYQRKKAPIGFETE